MRREHVDHPSRRRRTLGAGVRRALRASRRIRSKLIFLHTAFSLTLAVALLLVLRSPVQRLVRDGELRRCEAAALLFAAEPSRAAVLEDEGLTFFAGGADVLGIPDDLASRARDRPGVPASGARASGEPIGVVWLEGEPDRPARFAAAWSTDSAMSDGVNRLYMILTLCLLAVYALIALTLEVFVLPGQVYLPVERLLRADRAVQEGRREREIIPERLIPNDELGEIMRSRNASITRLREQERELERVLAEVEVVAGELKRKNYLLETARRNMADQDRLASLGMMSAGIAHELNTPLAVLKGCVERLDGGVDPERAALMLRVVSRLEGLSESLLDFARARPHAVDRVDLRAVVDEAWTLVSLDRDARNVSFVNLVADDARVQGDEDRLTQVFVNLLRNAVDATDGAGRIEVSSEWVQRDGSSWLSLRVRDEGPGIDPRVLARLFEPFATTRLDARGTGLGLAVANSIIKDHSGVILARNGEPGADASGPGAVFEVLLPAGGLGASAGVCDGAPDEQADG